MSIKYIADWHYGHKNSITFDNRPFLTVDEMNATLIQNWNKAVGPEDTIYILGDMFWCGAMAAVKVLEILNGAKILVRGNHDHQKSLEFKQYFDQIADYLEVEDDGRRVVLCHYPIPCFKNNGYGWFHLHGHVHLSFEASIMEDAKRRLEELNKRPCRMYNAGAMLPYMDYTPRTLDEIVAGSNIFFASQKEWTRKVVAGDLME